MSEFSDNLPLEIISHDVNDPVTPQSALKHYR